MAKRIMNIIDTKPELFLKVDTSIWTDPYIQQNLLDAHLDPDSDAASRNKESIENTIEFISTYTKAKSHILDLGCGPGLYAQKLTEKGYQVTGVDFNQKAIAYAEKNNPTNPFICADYIKNFPSGMFDNIIMIYCDMGTHSDDDRDFLLKNCYQSLNAGGKVIFDVFCEQIVADKREIKTWEYSKGANFWSNEPHVILQQTFHYPEHHVFAHQYNLILEGKTQYFLIWERYYTEEEITHVLKNMGFKNVVIKKDLLKSNNFTSSHEMFVVAEK